MWPACVVRSAAIRDRSWCLKSLQATERHDRGLSRRRRYDLKRPMVVAVAAVWVMQMSVHQVVDMVAVRHGLVTAAWTMLVVPLMATTIVVGRALVRIARVHVDDMLVEMIAVRVVKVTVMEVVHMVAVPYRSVAAVGTVLVRMVMVNLVLVVSHDCLSFGT